MVRRTRRAFTWLAAALVAAPATGVDAQEVARYRVLIPDFEALEGANRKFGENTAKALRELMSTNETHQPIERKEIEDNLKKFKIKMEELDCIRTRQLAAQLDAQVAVCASYSGAGPEHPLTVEFWDVASGEAFQAAPATAVEKQEQAAAQQIIGEFDRYVQQSHLAQLCAENAQSQKWDEALTNCDQAIELNPNAVTTRYQRARILFESNRYPEALDELKRVLGLNEFQEDALQLAGYVSAKEGQDDQALHYYQQYLELNPGNADVRMRVAYDLAEAGDPKGAMDVVQVGLDADPENADLWTQYGGYAFAAGLEVNQEEGVAPESGGNAPAAVEYFRKSRDAYNKVVAAKGAETPPTTLRNLVAVHTQLDEVDQALTVARSALETHAQDEGIWSVYADALQRAGQVDEAIKALDRVRQINPAAPNISLRQGNWLIQAGRMEEAVAVLRDAVRGNSQQADVAARLIFADAYKGIAREQYDYAVTGIAAAKQLPDLSPMMTSQLNFWHAYSLYNGCVKEQEPHTLASAQATLPKFQEAAQLFEQAREYAATQASINLAQYLTNTQTYIEIQQAIIKGGR